MVDDRTNVRPPGVAGMFYPSEKDKLSALIEKLYRQEEPQISPEPVSGTIIGGIVPHAGIEYCGRQAVHFFDSVRHNEPDPDTVIILHPNHHGAGPSLSVDDHHYWEVSNGIIKTDMEFARQLNLPLSATAQAREHSAEVIVPYILHFFSDFVKLVSVNMVDQSYGAARELAAKMHDAARKLKRRILVIASTDFSHFVSRSEARKMDDIVLDEITSRNPEGVYRSIKENYISVCGYGPIMTLMEYSSLLDHDYKTRILSRGDSGNIKGSSDVVSYVSALFHTDRAL